MSRYPDHRGCQPWLTKQHLHHHIARLKSHNEHRLPQQGRTGFESHTLGYCAREIVWVRNFPASLPTCVIAFHFSFLFFVWAAHLNCLYPWVTDEGGKGGGVEVKPLRPINNVNQMIVFEEFAVLSTRCWICKVCNFFKLLRFFTTW